MRNLKEWEDVLRILCKKGEVENAKRILEFLQRDFNKEEIDLLREAAIKNKNRALRNVLINMGVEDPIELDVSILKEEAKTYHTIGGSFKFLLQENPEKKEELMKAGEEILKIAVASGNYFGAKDLAKILGRKLQKDELETILKVSLERGELRYVEEIITRELDRMLTLEEVKVLIKKILEKWLFKIEAVVAVEYLLLSSSFVPEEVLENKEILEIAILTPRCSWLRISIIKELVNNGVKIPKSIVTKVLKEALDEGVSYQIVKFLVDLLERPLKTSEIKRLLKAKCKKGDLRGVIEIMKAHPEISPTKADLRRLCKAI